MKWSLEEARQDICSLLGAQTYAVLRGVENSLRSKDIIISDDFIVTDNRRQVLERIKKQFTQVEGPTVIMTGYFGSGKTAILMQLEQDLSQGQLCYGTLKVDPIAIRLNEEDTLSKFLQKLFNELAKLKGEGWPVEVYGKTRNFIGLPVLEETSLHALTTTLVGMHITVMSEVMQFIEELFKEYKRSTSNQRVIGLIIDELENITRTAELDKTEEENKLSALLRILLDKSVREYIKQDSISQDPYALVIFSIPERRDLLLGEWLEQDTADRCKNVEQNVNLTPETAEFLMKKMLRLYLMNVVAVAARNTDDQRISDWLAQLNSATDADNELFNYPIMPQVHQQISHRVLVKSIEGSIMTFRAYQVAIHTLLREWSGERQIDMRFMIDKVSELRFELRNYPAGVDLKSVIGEEHVSSLIDKQFRRMREGFKKQLTLFTFAGITLRATPMVMLKYKDLSSLLQHLPDEERVTEAAFAEICNLVRDSSIKGWSVTGDTLYLDVPAILSQLETPSEPPRPKERLQELLSTTEEKRKAKDITQLFQERIGSNAPKKSEVDSDKVLHLKDTTQRGQLIDEFLLAFDTDQDILKKIVEARKGCCIGVLFKEKQTTTSEDPPFSVTVVLPDALRDRASKYEDKVYISLAAKERWTEKFQPLISAIKRDGGSYYRAFKEAIKVMLLLPYQSTEDRVAFKQYELDLEKIIFDSLNLDDPEREEWIRVRLGLKEFHDIVPTKRLINVLSASEAEVLTYSSSDDMHANLLKKFYVPLPRPHEWKQELIDEWNIECFISDDRLVPYESWLKERRELYDFVHQALLQNKRLTFYEVGRLLFGNCQIGSLQKACYSLHLFLKLGKVRPLYWNLTDDTDDFSTMKVIPGELIVQQELRQARQRADQLIYSLVLYSYEQPPEKRTMYYSGLRWVLERKAKLEANASVATIQQIGTELRNYNLPPRAIGKVLVPQELISKIPANLVKLGEFLNKLNEIIRSDSPLSWAVSTKASSFTRDLDGELKCESILGNISRLYSNWGKPCPEEPKPDRLVVRISQEYNNEIGRTPGWAQNVSTESRNTFIEKISRIELQRIEKNVSDICTWLEQQVCGIIRPSWTRTYSDEEIDRLHRVILESAVSAAKNEIATVVTQLKSALTELNSAQANRIFARYRQTLDQHRVQLQQDDSAVAQLPNQLYMSQFGKILNMVSSHIKKWQTFYTATLQSQHERITLWLTTHDLDIYREAIEQSMNKVDMTVIQLCKELREQGVDALKLLRDTKATEILAPFAAAELLEILRMEATDDSTRENTN